jgi:hypothetical protein
LIAFGSLFIFSSLIAQTPEKISYQAVVRDNAQKLIANQSVGIRISILQGSATGTAVYVESHTVTTNPNGLVTLEIGSGTVASGSISGINWSTGTYFIKSETDPTGGTTYTLVGTSQLLSVPYALHAAQAETVPDNSLTFNKFNNSGALAGQVVTFNGSNPVWADPLGDISGVEAGDGLTGGAASGNAVLHVGGGTGINVGADAISLNTSYTDGLYVNEGQVNSISNPMLQDLSVNTAKISGAGASSGQVLSYNGSNVAWATPSGGSVWSLNGNVAYYNAGRVGIGTNSPSDDLHLYDAGNEGDMLIENSYPFLTFRTTTGNNAGILFEGSGGGYEGWIAHSPSNDAIVISGENTSTFNPKLVVASDGNVGIGAWTPTTELQVNGVITVGNLGIEDVGSFNLALNGDIVPRGGSGLLYDLGNNTATEHWDDVCANTFTVFSDARVKNSVETLGAGLNELMQLRPVKFKYNRNIDNDGTLRFGLIAQEVETIMPNLVINEDVDVNPETGEIMRTPAEFKTMNYMDLIPVLVNAIQEQQQRIEELEGIVESLRVRRIQ